jgi:hypothetical protein
MARRKPPPKPLRRRVGSRKPRRTLLVFCEGQRTEPEYLEALRREPSVREAAAVDLQVQRDVGGSAPLTLVNAAVEAKSRSEQEEGEIDEIWCLFDVEWPANHPKLHEAVMVARANGIRLGISNPCFELWLVLHFDDQTAFLETAPAQRLRCRHDGQEGKGLDGAIYMPKRSDAVRRAAALEIRHKGNGTDFPNDNPSSGVHHLLLSIEPNLL